MKFLQQSIVSFGSLTKTDQPWGSPIMRAMLICCVFACPLVAAEPETNDLFPLAIGNSWTYRVSGQDDRFVVKVVGIEKIGELLPFKLEASLRDRVVATEHLLIDQDSILRVRVDKDDVVPPLCICKLPSMKKATAKMGFRLGMKYGNVTYTTTLDEVVIVPAGRFTTVRVDADTTDNGVRVRTSSWFAPKIGIVKQTIDEAKRVLTLELEKHELK